MSKRRIWVAGHTGMVGSAITRYLESRGDDVDDLARGGVCCLDHYDAHEHINRGAGEEIPIAALAETVRQVVGFEGRIVFDTTKSDGAPRKPMDSSKPLIETELRLATKLAGMTSAYGWFLEDKAASDRARHVA